MSIIRSLLAELAPGALFKRRPVMAESFVKPPLRQPEAASPVRRKRDAGRDERSEAPENPKTSGAPAPDGQPLRNPLANRNPGPRQGGVTPRPTDEPIE
jgi:hypothetical protein